MVVEETLLGGLTMDWLKQNYKKYSLYEGRRKSYTYQDFTIGEVALMNLSKL